MSDPEWSEKFFHLLLELIKHWGEQALQTNSVLPVFYGELYTSLRRSNVYFPPEKKYMFWPLKDEPENLQ